MEVHLKRTTGLKRKEPIRKVHPMNYLVTVILLCTLASTPVAAGQTPQHNQEAPATAEQPPERILFAGGVSGLWLTVVRTNTKDPEAKAFDPSYTYLLCSFKPLVRKLANGQYEITFTSEIAEKLP